MTNTQSKVARRYEWVDLAKLLGLYLMILGHQNLVSENCSQFIYTFHMPLFFILSGVFFKKRTLAESWHQSWRTLICPFLIIATTWCFFYAVLYAKNGILFTKESYSHFLGMYISPGKDFFSLSSLCHALWFLLALAWIKMCATTFRRTIDWLLISAVCLTGFFCLKHYDVTLPLAIDSALLAFPFYAIGHFASDYIKQNTHFFYEIALAIVCFVITFAIYRRNGIVDINKCLYGNNICLFYIGGISGSLMICHISKAIVIPLLNKKYTLKSFIRSFLSGSVIIIGYNAYTAGVIRQILLLLTGKSCGLAVGLIVIGILYPVILLAKKYFPVIIGFRK